MPSPPVRRAKWEPCRRKSQSSALPDGAAKPDLTARVHRTAARGALSSVGVESLTFRQLVPADMDDIAKLHCEWFPLKYDNQFYEGICNGYYFALAAVYYPPRPSLPSPTPPPTRSPHTCTHTSLQIDEAGGCGDDPCAHTAMNGTDDRATSATECVSGCLPPLPRIGSPPGCVRNSVARCQGMADVDGSGGASADGGGSGSGGQEEVCCDDGGGEEDGEDGEGGEPVIVGVITVSTHKKHIHDDDVSTVLACGWPWETQNLAYILTLGVADEFRRRGLARELILRTLQHYRQSEPAIKAIYLHVVTYNKAAIRLYESLQFQQLKHIPEFYQLLGKMYDSYLYACYINGGMPPLARRISNALSSLTGWSLQMRRTIRRCKHRDTGSRLLLPQTSHPPSSE
ncbi:unnamed protein product [Vitrella brassicaformis CCMP3155]|uniref:N-alpha-acetyltransferase 60 n=2 Tax=Vitrella brassicaformis TaxID=1169539 RepID=A0A0G4E8R6_VITBC|nr:unnamed protein product [Vitrella brassicaformis CCMP3155]|eukprot:CEL92276.1 unnamed protein product [Vitrella brassicaformis CCMP3155]